ncbi:hypothetical protein BJ138DRAFT_1137695 [Hygrophoropsis aurantiaca]|uniref:Uncharacterized protein n=1 Tax=Hygrophoropsis aurantiaca TaxID=72124 RepID=A0ACB8A384_9AGAM|nr:hypothetical protein BJ138DRAFT_1137695 [Hygrophoropsis aurantiaca]
MIATFWLLAVPVVYYGLYYLGRWIRHKIVLRTTGLADLPQLGQSRPPGQKIRGTAVVCGGSVGGLLAARVCHDHFEKVVIVEPEAWLADEDGSATHAWTQTHRRGRVLQYYSFHALLPPSFASWTRLFPNLEKECEKSGIRCLPADFKVLMWGLPITTPFEDYGDRFPKTLNAGRQSTETLLRRLVVGQKDQYPNIEWTVGTVTGVTADPNDKSRLNNVVMRTADASTTEIEATLVIDCTGPAQAGLKWLQHAGYGFASDGSSYKKGTLPLDQLSISYNQKVQYFTYVLQVSPELGRRLPTPAKWDEEGVFILAYTDARVDRKFVAGQRIENNQLLLCCSAWAPTADLPRTLAEIKEFSRSMIVSRPLPEWFFELLDLLAEVEDTMELHTVHCPPSTSVRFHQATNLPSNYIALADSTMRVNPLFGKGITKASLGAISLNNVLHNLHNRLASSESYLSTVAKLPDSFAKDFFAVQWNKISRIWEDTRVFDYGWDTTVPLPGETTEFGAALRWWQQNIVTLAMTDRQAASAYWHALMLMGPPTDIFHPRLVLKILWRRLRHGPA